MSPRVSRRGSGRSRNVSESSNRPLSADQRHQHSDTGVRPSEDIDEFTFENADTTQTKTHAICLVKSRTNSAKSMVAPVQNEDNVNSQITFVKPQSRQGYCLAAADNTDNDDSVVEQSSQKISPIAEVISSALNTNTNSNHSLEDMQPVPNISASVSENENNNNSDVQSLSQNNSPLPSPKISPREPVHGVKSLVSSHTASIQSAILAEVSSAKPRKMRLTGSMSDTVLPTGSREKRSKSAKSQSAAPGLSKDDLELSEGR